MDIRNDRQKGLNYTEIGKKYHLDPRTAKRYALSETKPAYQLSGPKPSILDAYKHQIDQWLEEAPYSAVKILEKLPSAQILRSRIMARYSGVPTRWCPLKNAG